MAAAKPETLIFSEIRHKNSCGFACMQHMIENPTALPTCVGTRFPRELLTTLFVVHGSQKSKMAAAKPEVLVYRLLHAALVRRRWMAEATSSTAIHRKSEMATAPGT